MTFDGIPKTRWDSTTLSGGTVVVDTITAGNSQIGPAELGSGNVLTANISGNQVIATHIQSGAVLDEHISGGQIINSHFASAAVSGTAVSLEYATVKGIGSPAQTNIAIQAGSNATDGGSQVWLVFPAAFAAAPRSITATALNAAAGAGNVLSIGSVTAGSALVQSVGASTVFSWIAVGSGRI